ncbi:small integral membrane protein 15-like [Diadema setosum]|uniref:small integral membrane protein 15-like n=1 Tax=Diadema setosum TaxID=31175 RepID=UPI003B3B3425
MSGEEDIPLEDSLGGGGGSDGDDNSWKRWIEKNIILWAAKDPWGFISTIFMFLTPLFILSGILSYILYKDIEKKEKEKKRKAKRDINIAKARGRSGRSKKTD